MELDQVATSVLLGIKYSPRSVERRHPARDMHVRWTEDTTFIIEPTYQTQRPAKRYSKTIELPWNPIRTSKVAEPPKLTSVEEPVDMPERPSHPLPSSDIFQLPSPTSLDSPCMQQLTVLVEEQTDSSNATTQHRSLPPSYQPFQLPGPKEHTTIMETVAGAKFQTSENINPLVVQPVIAQTNLRTSFTRDSLVHEKVSDVINNEFVCQQFPEQHSVVSKKTAEPTTSEEPSSMSIQPLLQQMDQARRPISQHTTSIANERQDIDSQSEGRIVCTPQRERCSPRPMSQQRTNNEDQTETQCVESSSKCFIVSNQQSGDTQHTERPVSVPRTPIMGKCETEQPGIDSSDKVHVESIQQSGGDTTQRSVSQLKTSTDHGETEAQCIDSPSKSVVSLSRSGNITQRPMSQSKTPIIDQYETEQKCVESPVKVSVVSNQQSGKVAERELTPLKPTTEEQSTTEGQDRDSPSKVSIVSTQQYREKAQRPFSQQKTPTSDRCDTEEKDIESPSKVSVISNQPSEAIIESPISLPKTPITDQRDIKSPSKFSMVSTQSQRESMYRSVSTNSLMTCNTSARSVPLDLATSGLQSRVSHTQSQAQAPPSPAVYDPERFCRNHVTSDIQYSSPPPPVLPENAAQWNNELVNPTSYGPGFNSICEFCGGFRREKFTALGIILGIICFPCGLVCCFKCRETRCTECGR